MNFTSIFFKGRLSVCGTYSVITNTVPCPQKFGRAVLLFQQTGCEQKQYMSLPGQHIEEQTKDASFPSLPHGPKTT